MILIVFTCVNTHTHETIKGYAEQSRGERGRFNFRRRVANEMRVDDANRISYGTLLHTAFIVGTI